MNSTSAGAKASAALSIVASAVLVEAALAEPSTPTPDASVTLVAGRGADAQAARPNDRLMQIRRSDITPRSYREGAAAWKYRDALNSPPVSRAQRP
ncbi:hypothetical protein LBMAG44_13970 [Gemmatimonadota bacterium]|nr:hypothetical protein LBMAG44_13970 [Gemmatimonadota bacterium]